MNEPQRTVQPQKEVPPPQTSEEGDKQPTQESGLDPDGMQAGWESTPPAPDLDDPNDSAKDDDATDSPNT